MMAKARLEQQMQWLTSYQPRLRIEERGEVIAIGDGIAWITGLPSAAMDDLLEVDDGSLAMVFDLGEDHIGAILLRDTAGLKAGLAARLTGRTLSVPVGDSLLGRVIDPLGAPLDGGSALPDTRWQRLQVPSPPIIARDYVRQPLYTGIKVIDTMIPIGRGQRQLLIGDEGLGRSSIALDTVLNQREQGVHCVYVLIGQKRTTVVNIIDILQQHEALDYTTVVVAEASSLPGLQHLAPFTGCAVAEYWMQQGRDTLIVYDDLSTHARTYRELSLLLRRPPGREAYPGDIFSIHASLLERATSLNADHGGGSMTALPIVETQLGEIASYIPTNLISITDGQIYLDRSLFAGGFRPAIDIALSVSRIGGQAQHPAIKAEAGRMKLDYLQFLELEIFTRFGARLEASMEKAIQRGRVLREILKQGRLKPKSIRFDMGWLVAFNDGLFDDTLPEDVAPLMRRVEEHHSITTLDLDSPRENWSAAMAASLSGTGRDTLP